jgi:hypothetical protein
MRDSAARGNWTTLLTMMSYLAHIRYYLYHPLTPRPLRFSR